ncbi:hypothetical protein SDD30_04295 [Moorella naiadis]
MHYTGRLAATAAALTYTRPGAIPALPTQAEVEEEIQRNLRRVGF